MKTDINEMNQCLGILRVNFDASLKNMILTQIDKICIAFDNNIKKKNFVYDH